MRFFQKLPTLYKFLGIATLVAIAVVVSGLLITRSFSPTSSVQSPRSLLPQGVNKNPSSDRPYLGHLPYSQAEQSQLMMIGSYAQKQHQRFEFMDIEAGKALMQLIYAARDEGVWIVPVSGFRTIEEQKKLFEAQIKRRGSEQAAASFSAPPGYSEHATGLAVDLTDGRFPKQDVTLEFEKTDAFRWLTRHAKEFGFQMSFPNNNSQGVSYEPWHWRFVGSPRAAQIFASEPD